MKDLLEKIDKEFDDKFPKMPISQQILEYPEDVKLFLHHQAKEIIEYYVKWVEGEISWIIDTYNFEDGEYKEKLQVEVLENFSKKLTTDLLELK